MKFFDSFRPMMFPAFIVITMITSLINGGSNVDVWSPQRAIVFAGLLVALAVSLRDRDEDL